MKNKIAFFYPSLLEIIGTAFIALLILLIGNGKDLLQRYGLLSSSDVVKSQLQHVVGSGLGWLDSKSVTTNIVTFSVWGIVGLLAFSIVQTFLRASGKIKYEHEFSSNSYVHPSNFDRDSFWRQIILSIIISFGLMVIVVTTIVLYVFAVLPTSFTYARSFLLNPSVSHLGSLFIGYIALFASTLVLYLLCRFTVRHHRVSLA